MLHEQRVSAFPVLDDDNKVIGVVSEADLLTKEAFDGGTSGAGHAAGTASTSGRARSQRGRADDQATGNHRP